MRRGEVSPLELVAAAITCIDALNLRLDAVIHRFYDEARRQASYKPLSGVIGTEGEHQPATVMARGETRESFSWTTPH